MFKIIGFLIKIIVVVVLLWLLWQVLLASGIQDISLKGIISLGMSLLALWIVFEFLTGGSSESSGK